MLVDRILPTHRAGVDRELQQLCLLAYTQPDVDTLELLALGTHENFYRDLKR